MVCGAGGAWYDCPGVAGRAPRGSLVVEEIGKSRGLTHSETFRKVMEQNSQARRLCDAYSMPCASAPEARGPIVPRMGASVGSRSSVPHGRRGSLPINFDSNCGK